MLSAIIEWSLRNRLIVLAGSMCFIALGWISLYQLNIDAFPDTTPVQVQVNTVAPGLGPEEVERQITFLVEQTISGLPGLQSLRSISKFGLSQVVVTFEDRVDIYFARQLVTERLGSVELPDGIQRPRLGPVATGLGEVFHYLVTSDEGDLTAVKENNLNGGGGGLPRSGDLLLVQGIARTNTLEQIRSIAVSARDGVPIRVGDVAEVRTGSAQRLGGVTAQGRGEAVLGLGFLIMKENGHVVTPRLREKLDEVKPNLTQGVRVRTVYERTGLVDRVIDTVRGNLFEGGLLVIAVLFIFLGNLRAGLLVALAIPLSLLTAFCGMLSFGIAASLLSLGALDFGLVVDSSVVMVENVMRHLAHDGAGRRERIDVVRDAALEVRGPTMFGGLIIMIVYLPLLALLGAGCETRSLACTPDARSLRTGVARRPAAPACCNHLGDRLPRGCGARGARAGIGIRAPALGRGDRHKHSPVTRHQPGTIAPIQHTNGKDAAGGLPR